jgi:xanthine/CO dehydrogenase XdhC/CoxF family maturation factor
MRDVLDDLMRWWESGETVGVGTVVATFQSAPRPPGASMLVGPDETAVGSVSGGCVEGAVYDLAQEVTASGQPVLQRYGVSDDDAFAVGLTCGGILDVYVEKVSRETFPELEDLAADLDAGRPVAVEMRVRLSGAHACSAQNGAHWWAFVVSLTVATCTQHWVRRSSIIVLMSMNGFTVMRSTRSASIARIRLC